MKFGINIIWFLFGLIPFVFGNLYGFEQKDAIIDSINRYKFANPELVIDLCEAELAKDSTNNQYTRAILNELASASNKMLKNDEAIDYTKKVIRLSAATDDENNLAFAYRNYGYAYYCLKNFEDALKYYDSSLTIYEKLNDVYNMAALRVNIGVIDLLNNNFADALDHFLFTRAIFKEIGNIPGEARSIVNIGLIYAKLGETEKALQAYLEGYELLRNTNHKNVTATVLENIATRYRKSGNYLKADEYYKKSIEASVITRRSILWSEARHNDAELEIQNGNLDVAEQSLLNLIQFNRKEDHIEMLAEDYYALSKVHVLRKQNESALELLNKAEFISDSLHSIAFSRKVKGKKAELLYKMRRFKEAYDTMMMSEVLEDSITNQRNLIEIVELNAKYALQLKEKEISDLRISNNRMLVGFMCVVLILAALLIMLLVNRNMLLKSTNKKLTRYSEELKEAKDIAEKQNELKSDFLAQISHEIRSPISIILNFSSMLKEETEQYISDVSDHYFSAIERAGSRIIRTIDLILNMSDIQKGTYIPNKAILDVMGDIVNPLVDEYSIKAKRKQLALKIDDSTQRFMFEGDRFTVTQIFSNLIDNAVKYTREGEVSILTHNDADSFSFIVKDTGIGIADEFIPKLFDPFTQEEQGYIRSYEGSGLGMALVKRYCDLNNIKISVNSVKNKGTEFVLKFPKNN